MDRHTREILEKLSQLASACGLGTEIDEESEHLLVAFEFPDGRRQKVIVTRLGGRNYVSPSGSKSDLVTFISPARSIAKDGSQGGISRDDAVYLLQKNGVDATFARFGLWSDNDSDLVVATADALVETLVPNEFEAHARAVAILADEYEKQHSKEDDF